MEIHKESRYEQMRSNDSAVQSYANRFRGSQRTRTEENTRTCTAKQVLQAGLQMKFGGRFVIDNCQVYTVRICGRIVKIDQNESQTDYTVDDGTGMIDGRIWPLTRRGTTDLSGALLGAYYVIVGNIVSYAGGLLIQTLKAYEVKDHNQITLHLLSAIHEHCAASTLRRQDVQRWETAKVEAKETVNKSLSLELNKEAIVSYLSNDSIRSSDNGATSETITAALHMDFDEAWATLNAMLDEGSIYNTKDYKHFKLADEN